MHSTRFELILKVETTLGLGFFLEIMKIEDWGIYYSKITGLLGEYYVHVLGPKELERRRVG